MSVSKFVSECMDVNLGADSDKHLVSPRWLDKTSIRTAID